LKSKGRHKKTCGEREKEKERDLSYIVRYASNIV
jgi:hypothetical protein